MANEPPNPPASERDHEETGTPSGLHSVKMTDACPEDYDGTCLRPLGLCELGGSCDVCWYRPDHPRFRDDSS
jgi:hypothetical protein